jgi:LPS sulfotransferase NodH
MTGASYSANCEQEIKITSGKAFPSTHVCKVVSRTGISGEPGEHNGHLLDRQSLSEPLKETRNKPMSTMYR